MFFKGKERPFVIYNGKVTSTEWIFRKMKPRVTVAVPAAGSIYLQGWSDRDVPGKYTRWLSLDAPANSSVGVSSPSLVANHGLTVTYEAQREAWVLQLDSLPAAACTLTLTFKYETTKTN